MRKVIVVLVVLFIMACVGTVPYYHYSTVDSFTTEVTRLERVQKDGDGKYLVFTKDGVFENTDSWFWWKFDSSDQYGKLEEGHTYKFKTYGWRIRPLSWYKNIISFEEVK